MKGLVLVPASDVLPGEPRYWCEAGEKTIEDVIDGTFYGLHTESAEDCNIRDVTHAVVIRGAADREAQHGVAVSSRAVTPTDNAAHRGGESDRT